MNANRPIRFACLIAAAIAAHPAIAQDRAAERGGSGQNCSSPIIIPAVPFSASGSTTGFSNSRDLASCDSGGSSVGSPDVVYRFTPPYNMTVDISMCANTAYDSFLHVYEGECLTRTLIACNDDSCGLQSQVLSLPLVAGETYFIIVDGWGGNSGAYTLDIYEVMGTGNDCSDPITVPHLPFSTIHSTSLYSNAYNALCPGIGASDAAPDVVYRYTPPYDMTVDISTCANTAFDSFLHVYADDCASGSLVACDDDSCDVIKARIPELHLSAGVTYYIIVDGWFSSSGIYTLDITELSGITGHRCDGDAAFSLEPTLPPNGLFLKSDISVLPSAIRFDNFSFPDPITRISHLTFWGVAAQSDAGASCFPAERPMIFTINFHNDAAGSPGATIRQYAGVPVYPKAVPINLAQPGLQLLRFEVDLAGHPLGPCLLPSQGWMSLYGTGGPGCAFYWYTSGLDSEGQHIVVDGGGAAFPNYNLAFCLQGAPPVTCNGDVDTNNIVNIDDITFVILRLGNVCP